MRGYSKKSLSPFPPSLADSELDGPWFVPDKEGKPRRVIRCRFIFSRNPVSVHLSGKNDELTPDFYGRLVLRFVPEKTIDWRGPVRFAL